MSKNQSLREIFKITEWRNGCVFKTKLVGFAWVTFEYTPKHDGHLMLNSVSTKLMTELNHRTMRSVSDDTPDMCITTLAELRNQK